MPLTAEQKAQAVSYLSTLPPWKGAEATLNGLKDDQLVAIYNDQVKLQEADGVFNSVREFLGDPKLAVNAMPAAVAAKKACECGAKGGDGKPPVTNTTPPAAPQHDGTVEGWFKATNAPPAVVQVVTNALTIVGERKAELVGKLTGHIADPAAKAAAVATYNKLEPGDLKVMVDNMAAPATATTNAAPPIPSRLQPLYIGGAGGGNGTGTPPAPAAPTVNTQTPLGLPSIDHSTFWNQSKTGAA